MAVGRWAHAHASLAAQLLYASQVTSSAAATTTTPPVSTLLHTTAERAAQLKRVYRRARRADIIDFIAAHLCFSTLSLHLWTASFTTLRKY